MTTESAPETPQVAPGTVRDVPASAGAASDVAQPVSGAEAAPAGGDAPSSLPTAPAAAGDGTAPAAANAQEGQQTAASSSASPTPAPVQQTPPETRPSLIIRYGSMGLLGRFVHSLESHRCGQRVVIKSDRGMELGTVVCAWGGCGAPAGVSPQIRGEVLRPVTHADEVEERHLAESAQREFAFAKQCIASRGLPMKLVAVEHLFGGDRIIFYFISESRVDFRALVRDLAHEFQTRIEMRQIGVRDEARLLGDYERCGRPLCCRSWIKELEPVSMKMAKIQKATLDPTKISGRCGRLMCCLRFEHATYRELARNLPRKNSLVMTPSGRGKVIDTDVVSQLVAVLLEKDGSRVVVPVERLKPLEGSATADPSAPADAQPAQAGPPADDQADDDQDVPESRLARAVSDDTPGWSESRADGRQSPGVAPVVSPVPGDAATAGALPPNGSRGSRRGRRRNRRGGRNRRLPGSGGGSPPPQSGGQNQRGHPAGGDPRSRRPDGLPPAAN